MARIKTRPISIIFLITNPSFFLDVLVIFFWTATAHPLFGSLPHDKTTNLLKSDALQSQFRGKYSFRLNQTPLKQAFWYPSFLAGAGGFISKSGVCWFFVLNNLNCSHFPLSILSQFRII
jgi:hypothetical protein